MIHLNCREHLPCALATIDQLRRVNQQQADGWIDTHRDLTRARDENAELRRRLGIEIPPCGHAECIGISGCAERWKDEP